VRVVNDPDQDREPDRAGPKIAAGLTAAGAGVVLGPGAALILGAVSPLFESLAERAWEELRPDARRRAAQVLSTAAEAARCDAEQLGDLIDKSEQTRLQAGLAMAAAQRTTWPPKVRALGRVLAAGLIADGDAVDVPQFALNAMVELDRLHVSLLDLLVRYEPSEVDQHDYVAVPRSSDFDEWEPRGRKWQPVEVVSVRPELSPVFWSLAATLVRHALAEQHGTAIERHGIGALDPFHWNDGRSWLPTELGKQVLDYYLEAGAEAEITDSAAQADQ